MNKPWLTNIILLVGLHGAALCPPVLAQVQEGGNPDSDIVVTGRQFLSENSISSTKLDIRIAETPQSIAVLDEKLFRDLGLEDYISALNFIPGVQVTGNWGNFPTVYARGYDIDGSNGYKIDGSPMAGAKPLDNIAVERLEFVRGTAGTTFGEGGPGGFVNIITKSPKREFEVAANAQIGSFEAYRVDASVTGPLTRNGAVRAYVGGALANAGSFVRHAKSRDRALFGALDVDLGADTTLKVLAYYSHNRNAPFQDGWPNVPQRVDGDGTVIESRFPDELPISTYTGARWSFDDLTFQYYRAELAHSVSEALNLAVIGSSSTVRNPSQLADVCCSITEGANSLVAPINYLFVGLDSSAKTLEGRISGKLPFMAGSIRYLASAEYRRRTTVRQDSDYVEILPDYDLLNPAFDIPNPGAGLSRDELIATTNRNRFDIYSGSVTAIAEPVARLSVTLGLRYDRFKPVVENFTGNFETLNGAARFDDSQWSFRGAALYEVVSGVRAYYSYGETFEINTAPTCTGAALPPETGRSHEIGVKAELGRRLLMSVAAYDIRTRDNLVPLAFEACPGVTLNPAEPGPGQTSRGLELDLTGNLTPAWNIIAGYSYTDAELQDFRVPGVPRHQASLFTVYDLLDGPLQGVGVGGGFTYLGPRNATFPSGNGVTRFGSQLRADMSLYYRPRTNWSVSMNIQNLFDEKDPVSSLQSSEFQNMYLAPRTVQVAVSWRM